MALYTRHRNGFSTDLSSWDMALLEYLPLVHTNEIRLVYIQPGTFDDPLLLDVVHFTLDQNGLAEFDALSYVWGSPHNPSLVKANIALSGGGSRQFDVFVTQNLANALKHLRYTDKSRTVWADAICINQQDYDERAQQVLMMGDIYRLARSVVAFLGPEMNESSLAMEFIERLSGLIEVDFASGHVTPSQAGLNEPGWADMHKALDVEPHILHAINHLIHREWFERLWIRQEIGLGGPRAVLLCGKKDVKWSSFCRAIFVLHRRSIAKPGLFEEKQYRAFRDRLGKADTVALYSKRAFRFINLRRQIGMSKCSDQRDRIYGVLGQLRQTDQIGIIPDYTQNVNDVYVDATAKHIQHFKNLSILCQCELQSVGHVSDLLLPSWVPDWSSPMISDGLHEAEPPLFSALPCVESLSQNVLRAYGMRCKKVARVADPFGIKMDGMSAQLIAQTVRDVICSLESFVKEKSAYPDQDSTREAYCRCLWLNNFADRWSPPVPHEAPYKDCLTFVCALLDFPNDLSKAIAWLHIDRCIERLRDACRSRAMFVTEDGFLGMAAESVEAGDEICLLFGTWKPIVLRPSSGQDHRVVGGECYLNGMMHAQPIFGALPPNLRGLLNPNGLMGLRSAGFIDVKSGQVIEEDPRIAPFLASLVSKGLLSTPTLNGLEKDDVKELLVKAGVPIHTFNLV